jgi:hypothetical protein
MEKMAFSGKYSELTEKVIRAFYAGQIVGEFICDFLVESKVKLELKSVKTPTDQARGSVVQQSQGYRSRSRLVDKFMVPKLNSTVGFSIMNAMDRCLG